MKRRIKILFCIDQLNIGGTEKQLLAIIERLDREQFEPYLVCLQATSFFEQCDIDDCNKQVLGVTSLSSRDGFGRLWHFSKYLRKEKIDIVQTFFFDSTVFGVLAAKLAGVRKVVSCRRDMGFWYTAKLLFVLRGINLLTDRVLVNSKSIKENVCRQEHVNPKKVNVIYNGIDLAPFAVKYDVANLRAALQIPANDFVVGIVANLNRHVKRVDLFIEAAAKVLEKLPKTSFVIVGDGHLRKSLEYQAIELGVSGKIYFVGSQEDVMPYLQLFDIAVLTSESEGFSNSLIEYMAAGIPSMAIDSGGSMEIIQNGVNGYLITDGSARSFANKICLLLNEKNERSRMAKTAQREIMLNYSWDQKIKEVEICYFDLMRSDFKK